MENMEGPNRILLELENDLFNLEIPDSDFLNTLNKKWREYEVEENPDRMDPRFLEILRLIKQYREDLYNEIKEKRSPMWLGYIMEIEK